MTTDMKMNAAPASVRVSDSVPYDRYVQAEWSLFQADPARRSGVAGLSARCVLDVGCGAGQELRPFVRNASTFGVGIDISAEVGQAGRALFAADEPESHVAFARAAAEYLPFPAAAIDLVICRLALPYTDNARALAEIARVLRPGGVLLLKFHHPRYYTAKFREACKFLSFKSALHACRVLLAGAWYCTTRVQPRNRLIGNETFQTLPMLRRELEPLGLAIRGCLADSGSLAPSLLIVRCGTPPYDAGNSKTFAPCRLGTTAGNQVDQVATAFRSGDHPACTLQSEPEKSLAPGPVSGACR